MADNPSKRDSKEWANPNINVDRHGVQQKHVNVERTFFKSAAIFGMTAVCLWISFRRRDSWTAQAAVAAFGLMITVPIFRAGVETLSLAIETRRRNTAERKSWKMCERRIYRQARMFVTIEPDIDDEGALPRQVCVVEHNAGEMVKPTILFVHGSMAQLSQFDKQIQYFTKVAVCMLLFVHDDTHARTHACTHTHTHIHLSLIHI